MATAEHPRKEHIWKSAPPPNPPKAGLQTSLGKELLRSTGWERRCRKPPTGELAKRTRKPPLGCQQNSMRSHPMARKPLTGSRAFGTRRESPKTRKSTLLLQCLSSTLFWQDLELCQLTKENHSNGPAPGLQSRTKEGAFGAEQS